MMSYKLYVFNKNGKCKEEVYPYKDYSKAYRKLRRSSKRCSLWFVVDGQDYRLVERNYSEVDE